MKLLVLGDLLLDLYTWGDAERISPEAPVPVICVDHEVRRLGGATSVARLLRGLGAKVSVSGVVGADGAGKMLQEQLAEEGIDSSLVLEDPQRCTTTKQRLIGRAAERHPHQMLRIDREVRDPISAEHEERLAARIGQRLTEVEAVLVADYGKGMCTPRLLQSIVQAAVVAKIPVAIDPARGVDYDRYRGASLLKPNRNELEQAANCRISSPADAMAAAEELRDRYNFPAVLATLDRDGLVLARDGAEPVHQETRPRGVYDITGAGDMALAMIGWCLATGASWDEMLPLINAAAGLEVERFGVSPVSWAEIRAELAGHSHTPAAKLISAGELTNLGVAYREAGKRVVFTNGCFDLLHIGHVTTLQQAASLGDILIVGVNSDASVRRLKGPDRPVIREQDRAALLAALGCVTHVVIFDDETPHDLLRRLRPDILAKGGTYAEDEVIGRDIVQSYGGEVRIVGNVAGVSTTGILSAVRSNNLW